MHGRFFCISPRSTKTTGESHLPGSSLSSSVGTAGMAVITDLLPLANGQYRILTLQHSVPTLGAETRQKTEELEKEDISEDQVKSMSRNRELVWICW